MLGNLIWRMKETPMRQAFRKYGRSRVPDIPTHTKRGERLALYNLAASLPSGSRVLEIGSYLGSSACFLAAGISRVNGRLYCVDTWQNETMPDGLRDTYTEFCRNTSAFQKYIIPLRKNSADILPQDFDGRIAMAFFDGDHSYEAVSRDFRVVSSCLAEHAIAVFHDYQYFDGVSRFVAEVLCSGDWLVKGVVNNLIWLQQKKRKNANH